MPGSTTLCIRQQPMANGLYPIRLRLDRPGQAPIEAEANIAFSLAAYEQEDLRWYMEDYLNISESVEVVQVEQIELMMKERGEELYDKVLMANRNTQAIWFAIRDQLADLRIEINTGIAEAAAIPWELMRDPESSSAIALRVKVFVRVQSNPNIGFVPVPSIEDRRIRLLYVICRPGGTRDKVTMRAIANRLLQGLAENRPQFDITVLRPPTYERLQKVLADAKEAGRPYHIVHFDGHGIYADLGVTPRARWLSQLSNLIFDTKTKGKHGYLLFEHPSVEEKMRPIPGEILGQLLHDSGVPMLVLNACQSAMHEAIEKPADATTVHDEVRAIGSLAQAVVDQGIPAVLGMRYSVFVVTAAQYIGELYTALAKGRSFGQAGSEARKHLQRNPDRWMKLQARSLQDWFVPVIYEAMPLNLLPSDIPLPLGQQPELDPVQSNPELLHYVPDQRFIGRDETLLMLDRAFDVHPIVLLHAYAGQGKTATAMEFARWYALTGGLGLEPIVILTSFEQRTTLDQALKSLVEVKSNEDQPLLTHLVEQGKDWLAINEPEAKRSEVIRLLRKIPVLWIWDNVEPVAGFPEGNKSAWTSAEQAELANFLKQIKQDKNTKAKILLTSRREEQSWLAGIPQRVKMPRMSNPDAAALVMELGQERGMERAKIADWQPLLDYCVGNPLTLLIITSQVINLGLRREDQIGQFIQAVRDGEQNIVDTDEAQGRDRSLGASLDYGLRNAFKASEMPVIALLHLFQGVVDSDVLFFMGQGDDSLPELKGKDKQWLSDLLKRASDTGLLTYVGGTWYGIHPALPWYLHQVFDQHYNGQDGRFDTEAVLRIWVKTVGDLSNYFHQQFIFGNQDVIQFLSMEEANLLHARRLAHRHGWWDSVISAMQGLWCLYQYQGRSAEWRRLVEEIVPDYCTADDEPIAGLEDNYTFIMHYRVSLYRQQNRDLVRAAALQEKRLKWNRRQAAAALEQPEDVPLSEDQRDFIHNLAVAVETQGHILREQNNGSCVECYEEAIRYCRRIKDTAEEAINHYNIGRAYTEIPAIRDLDAAETNYQIELTLLNPNDAPGRAFTINRIGTVFHDRYMEACRLGESEETLQNLFQVTEAKYLEALKLCPSSTIATLGPLHGQLGALYNNVGKTKLARKHYEQAMQCFDQTDDRHHSGRSRYGLAVMHMQAATEKENPARRRDLLNCAMAYAQASLRDFRHYQGRDVADETKAQKLIESIKVLLAKLP